MVQTNPLEIATAPLCLSAPNPSLPIHCLCNVTTLPPSPQPSSSAGILEQSMGAVGTK
jgi:hypothetical protein